MHGHLIVVLSALIFGTGIVPPLAKCDLPLAVEMLDVLLNGLDQRLVCFGRAVGGLVRNGSIEREQLLFQVPGEEPLEEFEQRLERVDDAGDPSWQRSSARQGCLSSIFQGSTG